MQYKVKLFNTPASIASRQEREYFSQLSRTIEDLNVILADINSRLGSLAKASSPVSALVVTVDTLNQGLSILSNTVGAISVTQESHTTELTSLGARVDVLEAEAEATPPEEVV